MENKVSKTVTVSLVNISDIYTHLKLTNQEVEWIDGMAWNNVSYGDAEYTLIGNVFALDCMLDGYEDYHKHVIANKSMTRDDFCDKFWEIVNDADYINLEN